MDLSALVARFRTLSGDHAVPPLWHTRDVIGFFNEAEREAAERARLLFDRHTPGIVEVPLLAGQREYRLHPKVFDVESAAIRRPGSNGATCALSRASAEDMRWSLQNRPNLTGWGGHFMVYGEASSAEGKHIVLDRVPEQPGGMLVLECYRYPLVDMEDPGDEPEIAPRHHDGLVHWALAVAYRSRDMEADAEARANRHEAEFERRFGLREDANVMRKQLRHRAGRVKPARW